MKFIFKLIILVGIIGVFLIGSVTASEFGITDKSTYIRIVNVPVGNISVTGMYNTSNTTIWWADMDEESDIRGSVIQNDLGWINASGSTCEVDQSCNNILYESDLPLENKTLVHCSNVSGAASNLCTITAGGSYLGYYNVSLINNSELEEQADGKLGLIDTFINALADSRINAVVTKAFIKALDFYEKSEVYNKSESDSTFIPLSDLPLENKTLVSCANVSGSASNLCTITDTNESTRVNTITGTDCDNGNYSYGRNSDGTILCRNDVDTDTTRSNAEIINVINGSSVEINCSFIQFDNGMGSAGICDGTDDGGGASDGNVSSICSDNEVLLGQDTPLCVNLNNTIIDLDTDTTYTNGTGIDLTGTTFSIVLSYFQGLFIELTDSFSGEVSGTYNNIVLDHDALDDQYYELTDDLSDEHTHDSANITDAGSFLTTHNATYAAYETSKVSASGDTMTGNLNMSAHNITNVREIKLEGGAEIWANATEVRIGWF